MPTLSTTELIKLSHTLARALSIDEVSGGEHTSQRVELVLPDVNRELRRLGKPRMSMRELRDKMDQLTELGCLTPTPLGWHLKGKVWLTT